MQVARAKEFEIGRCIYRAALVYGTPKDRVVMAVSTRLPSSYGTLERTGNYHNYPVYGQEAPTITKFALHAPFPMAFVSPGN